MWETWVQSLAWEDPLEKGIATHSSVLAWKIPWTLLSMGSQRGGHDWVTFTLPLKPGIGGFPGGSGASLIAQLVKNLPAMQETLVQLLAQEDPLEKG